MNNEKQFAGYVAGEAGAIAVIPSGDSYPQANPLSNDSFSTEFQQEIDAELKHIRSKSF